MKYYRYYYHHAVMNVLDQCLVVMKTERALLIVAAYLVLTSLTIVGFASEIEWQRRRYVQNPVLHNVFSAESILAS